MLIQATPYAMTSRGRDKLAWAESPQGNFSLKSAYSIAMGQGECEDFSAGWVWKVNTLPRIKTFLWMCAHNSIGVRSCLMKRGVCVEELCLVCQEAPESVLHALRDFAWVKPLSWCGQSWVLLKLIGFFGIVGCWIGCIGMVIIWTRGLLQVYP